MSEISLHGTAYGFLVDHGAIRIEKIRNVNAYLMIKRKFWLMKQRSLGY